MIRSLPKVLLISLICLGFSNYKSDAKSVDPEKTVLDQSSFWTANSSANTLSTDDNDNKFIIYINDGALIIKYNKPQELMNGEVVIFNLLGQEITRKKLEINILNQVTLSTQNTCYIVKISYSGKVHTQKVVASGK